MGAPNSTNKYGGSSLSGVSFGAQTINGNTINNCGHVTLTLPGEAVTFAFRSDSSASGNGYGYYAMVTGYDASNQIMPAYEQTVISGEYKEPIASNSEYTFSG